MDTKDLVTLCQQGDRQAFDLLYEKYSEKMLKVCLHYVHDRTAAQDLLHDGFVVIFTSIHALRNPESLEQWMKRIMKNLALQYLNQLHAHPAVSLTDIPEEEEPAENSCAPDFPSYDQLLDVVESLPEGYCKVFKLAVLEGLSHKEIGDLLDIAPHSSSSQLSRAKVLLKKMLAGYRVLFMLILLFLFPALHDYLHKEKKGIREIRLSRILSRKAGRAERSKKKDTPRKNKQPPAQENANDKRHILPPVPLVTELPLAIPSAKDSLYSHPIPSPFTRQTVTDRQIAFVSSSSPMPPARKKSPGKWKMMLAGSLGPQLAQNLYKLMATPSANGISGDFPQQVDTWEKYYTYLHTRYQQGTLGEDSIGLMQIARNNSGKIVENRQHHAPVTIGLSFSKKLDERWGVETGLQYTLLKSEFTTGHEFRIQENQKLHYIGIPLRISRHFWSYKHFSGYATAGMQIDIPVKGNIKYFHITDSIPHTLNSRSASAPWQWSVNTSVGIQYHLTPHASIYLEPTLNYYIPDGSQLRTIRKEHPFTFNVPIGLRISW